MLDLLNNFNAGYDQRMDAIAILDREYEETVKKTEQLKGDIERYVVQNNWINAVLRPLAEALANKLGWECWDASNNSWAGMDPDRWATIYLGAGYSNEDNQSSLTLYCEARGEVLTLYYALHKGHPTPKTITKVIDIWAGDKTIKVALLPDTLEEILTLFL